MDVMFGIYIFDKMCFVIKLIVILTLSVFSILLQSHYVFADLATGTRFSIEKNVSPQTVARGGSVIYSVTIKNITTSETLTPEIVEDKLPQGFVYSGEPKLVKTSGEEVAFEPVSTSDGVIRWEFDGDTIQQLNPNQSIVITYKVRVDNPGQNTENEVCLIEPEEICAKARVNISTAAPNAGINDVFLPILILISIIMILSFFNRPKSFERNILEG
ncbi:MAG: DUF11 domain-containing protein [Candidatus Dojkabacteria bacterium]|nr:DUF11 domain-containing protein [Candidatus Dojkabacteria bacterium]